MNAVVQGTRVPVKIHAKEKVGLNFQKQIVKQRAEHLKACKIVDRKRVV